MAYDPTYTYDWPQIINDLEDKYYDAEQCAEVREAAKSWRTCPCSTLSDHIRRYDSGRPRDAALSELGMQFHSTIRRLTWISSNGYWTHAAAATARVELSQIRLREAELLCEAGGA